MKGHTKKVTAITINAEAQQVLVWFIAWNPRLGKALGSTSNLDWDSCALTAPHSDMIQSWLADIHRISRQDSANMAHGDWPSKHFKLHTNNSVIGRPVQMTITLSSAVHALIKQSMNSPAFKHADHQTAFLLWYSVYRQ